MFLFLLIKWSICLQWLYFLIYIISSLFYSSPVLSLYTWKSVLCVWWNFNTNAFVIYMETAWLWCVGVPQMASTHHCQNILHKAMNFPVDVGAECHSNWVTAPIAYGNISSSQLDYLLFLQSLDKIPVFQPHEHCIIQYFMGNCKHLLLYQIWLHLWIHCCIDQFNTADYFCKQLIVSNETLKSNFGNQH